MMIFPAFFARVNPASTIANPACIKNTKAAPIKSNKQFIFMLVLIIVLVVIAIIWSIKQITVGSTGANITGYFNK